MVNQAGGLTYGPRPGLSLPARTERVSTRKPRQQINLANEAPGHSYFRQSGRTARGRDSCRTVTLLWARAPALPSFMGVFCIVPLTSFRTNWRSVDCDTLIMLCLLHGQRGGSLKDARYQRFYQRCSDAASHGGSRMMQRSYWLVISGL